MSQFQHEICRRISETQDSLALAHAAADEYLVGVRLGELESLARVATEHGLKISGLEESLARHGLTTPTLGVPLTVDRYEAEILDEIEITVTRRQAR